MTKRIGILGGISAASTAEYYERIIRKYFARRGDYYYPEIVIFSLNFQRFTDYEDAGDRSGYITEIMSGVRALERAGVDLIMMAANSPHAVFADVSAQAAVPMLSIVRVTAQAAHARGLRRLLLLGIKFTMQSSFYAETGREFDLAIVTPAEAEQDEINAIIFDELARGIIAETSRRRLLEIIRCYPVDGVILGCTELPLLLNQDVAIGIPLLDTLDLHAEGALDFALADD